MVLRLWQEWQRLCRFSRSVNTAQSPLCGMMWSTSVALVRRRGSPGGYRTAHSRQNGSRRSCPGRSSSVHSGVEYIQRQDRDDSLRRAASLGLCAAQYPPDTRAQHPGCLHGLKGFCAIGLSPPGKTKEPGPTRPHCGSCGSGSLAQAQIDVQKSLPLAMAAIGIGPNFAVRWEPEELHRLAHRADDPSIR